MFFTGKEKGLALEEVSSQLLLCRTDMMICPMTLNLLSRVRCWHPCALNQSSIRVKAEKKSAYDLRASRSCP